MKVKYRKFFPDSDIKYPLLSVTLKNGKAILNVNCLVDSGATGAIFSTDIARQLGINLRRCKRHKYVGIGDIVVRGYLFTIDIQICGLPGWVRAEVGFVNSNEMPLLGQSPLFEHFEVIFETYYERLQIKPKPKRKARPKRTWQ